MHFVYKPVENSLRSISAAPSTHRFFSRPRFFFASLSKNIIPVLSFRTSDNNDSTFVKSHAQHNLTVRKMVPFIRGRSQPTHGKLKRSSSVELSFYDRRFFAKANDTKISNEVDEYYAIIFLVGSNSCLDKIRSMTVVKYTYSFYSFSAMRKI